MECAAFPETHVLLRLEICEVVCFEGVGPFFELATVAIRKLVTRDELRRVSDPGPIIGDPAGEILVREAKGET